MTDDTHKALADEMRARADTMQHKTCEDSWYSCPLSGDCANDSAMRDPECTCGVEWEQKNLRKWADRVEALEQEVEDLKTKNIELQMIAYPRTLRQSGDTLEPRYLYVGHPKQIERIMAKGGEQAGALSDSSEGERSGNRETPSTEPAAPRCKHCGHPESEHKGEGTMSPGCLHVLPDDPGDGKTRYYCTCPGYE